MAKYSHSSLLSEEKHTRQLRKMYWRKKFTHAQNLCIRNFCKKATVLRQSWSKCGSRCYFNTQWKFHSTISRALLFTSQISPPSAAVSGKGWTWDQLSLARNGMTWCFFVGVDLCCFVSRDLQAVQTTLRAWAVNGWVRMAYSPWDRLYTVSPVWPGLSVRSWVLCTFCLSNVHRARKRAKIRKEGRKEGRKEESKKERKKKERKKKRAE